MDLNANGDSSPRPNSSICLKPVGDQRTRSIDKICLHEFDIDNAHWMMQLGVSTTLTSMASYQQYADFRRQKSVQNLSYGNNGSIVDATHVIPQEPIGFRWCPICGFTQKTSVIEQEGHQPSPYYDMMMGNKSPTGRDNAAGSSSSNSQNNCPSMARHSMQAPSSISAPMDTQPIHESTTQLFHYRVVPGAHSGVELMNPQGFPAEFIPTFPLAEHEIHQSGIRTPNKSRTDVVGPLRVRLLPVLAAYPAGPVPVPRSRNAVSSTGVIVTPPVAEVRTNHSRSSSGSTASATGHIPFRRYLPLPPQLLATMLK